MPIIDPSIVDLDDLDDSDDDDHNQTDEYGTTLPVDLHQLHADGDLYDLRDPDQVLGLIEHLKDIRFKLNHGELKYYEGVSTDWGEGGRARLLYDQLRADLALARHAGKNIESWVTDHTDAMETIRQVAVAQRHRWS